MIIVMICCSDPGLMMMIGRHRALNLRFWWVFLLRMLAHRGRDLLASHLCHILVQSSLTRESSECTLPDARVVDQV